MDLLTLCVIAEGAAIFSLFLVVRNIEKWRQNEIKRGGGR